MSQESPRPARFPELRPLAHAFFEDLLALVRKRFGEPPRWPTADFYDIEYNEVSPEQIYAVTPLTKREYPTAGLYSIWSEIEALDSFQSASRCLRTLGEAGQIRNLLMAGPTWGFFRSLAVEYLARSRSCGFDEEVFNHIYEVGEQFLVKDHVMGKLFIDLVGLKAQTHELVLSPRHRVLRLDHDMARRIWAVDTSVEIPVLAFFLPGARAPFPMPNQVVLEATFEVESAKLNEAPLARSHEFRACALALRLCEPGSGAIHPITEEYEPLVPGFVRSRGFHWPSVGTFSYTLDEAAATRVSQAWPTSYEFASELELNEENVPPPLRIAVRRFGGSFERLGDEDRLIDYMIALEALLGRENEAISYRIPLRSSTLLGASALERARIFDVLKAAYNLRSQFAHGSCGQRKSVSISGEIVSWKDFLLEVQHYLIRCIRLFIKAHERLIEKKCLLAIIEKAIVSQDRAELGKQLHQSSANGQS
jgi:hypothetical protein